MQGSQKQYEVPAQPLNGVVVTSIYDVGDEAGADEGRPSAQAACGVIWQTEVTAELHIAREWRCPSDITRTSPFSASCLRLATLDISRSEDKLQAMTDLLNQL